MDDGDRDLELELRQIADLGHREFVGGMWDEIGRHQFDFLVAHGLEPHDVLLDVACGALRGGRWFIPYLEPDHYLGLDQYQELLDRGLEELGPELVEAKRPELIADAHFSFERFSRAPDVALAQSLFTHLTSRDIVDCLTKLRRRAKPTTRFWATFFNGDSNANPPVSASRPVFRYPAETMAGFGETAGWRATYVGNWEHPRNQMMMLFEPAPG